MRLHLGHFELDADRLELRRPEGRVAAEPRVLEVLIHLVRHRDRVVSKEELARDVWGLAHVTDAAVARAILEARKALGGERKWIETVYGRGYRFVGPVSEAPPDAPPPIAPAAPPEPAPSPAPGPAAGPAAPAAVPRARPGLGRWRPALLALPLLLLGGFALERARQAPDPAEPALRLALLPFAVGGGGGQELRLAALSVSDLLHHRLSALPEVALRPQRGPGAAEADPGVVAQRTGVDHVLSGRVSPVGPEPRRAVLEVTLHEILPTGAVRAVPLGRHELPYLDGSPDLARFVAVRDAVVRRLADAVLLRLDSAARPQNAPRHLAAYRSYLQGTWEVADSVCRDRLQLLLARRAVDLDPRFAPAWYLYGRAHCSVATACGEGAGHYREAERALDRALELDPGHAGALEVKAVLLLETGRIEEAYRLLAAERHRFAAAPRLHLRLSQALHHAGFVAAARREVEAVLAAEPELYGFWDAVPYPYLYERRWERFLALLPDGGDPYFDYYRGFAELMRGRRGAAAAALRNAAATEHEPGLTWVALSRALLALAEGRRAEGRQELLRLWEGRRLAGALDGEFTYKIGELLVLAGDREAGLAALGTAVRQGFFCVPWLEADPALAGVRGDPRFAALLTAARERHLDFARRFGLAPT